MQTFHPCPLCGRSTSRPNLCRVCDAEIDEQVRFGQSMSRLAFADGYKNAREA